MAPRWLAAAGVAALASAQLPTPPPMQPFALAGVVDQVRANAANATLAAPTGLTRAAYLDTINSVVSLWLSHQAPNGSIVDPYEHQEMQYATPCFAWASALLVVTGRNASFLGPASAALTYALSAMHNGSAYCAQATCDFYALPVVHAYTALLPLVDPALGAGWTAVLASLEPNKTYEFTGQNWELTAAAGEWIRMQQLGFANGYGNWSFWEARIGRLATVDGAGFWNPNGQFQDNWGMAKTSPHAYDAFADAYTVTLLSLGYNGAYQSYLSTLMGRGAWTHALFQSPWGEIPAGGRSGQHTWNDAVMAAQYEIAAVAADAAGDAQAACALRRAARLSHFSLRRWLRPDGGVQILKNWFDPSLRWGYEEYSFYSQYSLLPMAWLANAYIAATDDDRIPECAAPADVGGAAFALPYPTFRKVFANARGTFVEVMAGGADPAYECSGFYRVHFRGCATTAPLGAPCDTTVDSLLGPSAGPPPTADAAITIGSIWWATQGGGPTVASLANQTLSTVTGVVFTEGLFNTPDDVSFTLQYVLWDDGAVVTEAYNVSATGSVTLATSVALAGEDDMLALLAGAAAGSCGHRCTLMPPADAAERAAVLANDVDAMRALRPVQRRLGASLAAVGVFYPAIVYDGRNNYTVSVTSNGTTVSGPPASGAVSFAAAGPNGPLSCVADAAGGADMPARNGVVRPVTCTLASGASGAASPTLTSIVRVAAPAVPPA